MIMMANDIRGWMGSKFSRYLFYSWEKNLNQENWHDQGSNSGPLGERHRCYSSIIAVLTIFDCSIFLKKKVLIVNRLLLFCRTKVMPTGTWGYPINDTDHYDGVIGYLQRGEVEMASVGLNFKSKRIDHLDYVGETVLYEWVSFCIFTLPFIFCSPRWLRW